MTEKAKKYLVDIQKAVELIEDFSNNLTDFFQYKNDLKTKSAIERQLGIIGEAVNQFRKQEQEVVLSNTRQMVDFRNRLIHSYNNVDDTIVWAILKRHIPILKEEIERELKEE